MKLTLAMGLQYDNGKQASMVALSLGQDKPLALQGQQHPIEAVVVGAELERDGITGYRAGENQTGSAAFISDQIKAQQTDVDSMGKNQSSIVSASKAYEPFFLTYNIKGLSDTLVFEQTLVDLFV